MTEQNTKDKIAKAEAERPEPVIRDILPSDRIIGVRLIGHTVHVWLIDSRTSTARRVEFSRDAFNPESLALVEAAHDALSLK